MKAGQKLWTRNELLLAINLYSKIPFGKMHSRNPQVVELANLINRKPGGVAWKLVNLASLDPSLKKRNIKGAEHRGNLDEQVWNEFHSNWDEAFEESEKLLASFKHTTVEQLYEIDISDIHEKGIERRRLVNTRVNQYRFREIVMINYNSTCCITGIQQPQLLIASHITSWSKFENNRLNPMNGLCLNALHDKAFDNRLITISASDYTIRISSVLKKISKGIENFFLNYEGKKINLPKKFLPDVEFLKIHNDHFIE
jgi:putative restriction endonuclease